MSQKKIKAVFFDFMGTCLDWHTVVAETLPSAIPADQRSDMALQWRQRYFDKNHERIQQKLPPEDIDITLVQTLDDFLGQDPKHASLFDDAARQRLIAAWHAQPAWPEVAAAIQAVRERGYEVFVHANGTTRLQLDLVRASGLSFNMLFSSQLLGVYKPKREAYERALELVKLRPDQVVLVAAHAYDLRGAQSCGLKTIYISRWTDDIDEDKEALKGEFDIFLEDMTTLPDAVANLG